MKFSYNWLQTHFSEPLPEPHALAELITFHSSEVEEVIALPHDTVFDIKILPDKSAWLLSHRGLAAELAVILEYTLLPQPKYEDIVRGDFGDGLHISVKTEVCDYYSGALLQNISSNASPQWLKERLEAIGQRSINAVVDITNYVLFETGQPLHAFAAEKLSAGTDAIHIGVRSALDKEKITTLSGETYELTTKDTVIVDARGDMPIGIAGVKGGEYAAVTNTTTSIVLEAGHFDRYAVRATAKRLKLPTDAAKRYENGLSVARTPEAFLLALALLREITGATITAVKSVGNSDVKRPPVTVSLRKINSVLGLTLQSEQVEAILKRYSYNFTQTADGFIVTPPLERDDLVIAEDIIEEIGRIHGLSNIVAIAPQPAQPALINQRQYYADEIRLALCELGFSEVYTSSFRAKDTVRLANALASDKGYLRSSLVHNLEEARALNAPYRDLLGLPAVLIFEIGTVFTPETEEFRVGIAVQSGTTYKAKVDEQLLMAAIEKIQTVLGVSPTIIYHEGGVLEFSLDALLPLLPVVTAYRLAAIAPTIVYQSFSMYPPLSRDVALFVPTAVTPEEVEQVLRANAGPLCVRISHIDTFTKETRTSYAFRLVFQSKETTLTDIQIESVMKTIYAALSTAGWEVR
jgi:phenylalanyl-tRNA synthetase beta chain